MNAVEQTAAASRRQPPRVWWPRLAPADLVLPIVLLVIQLGAAPASAGHHGQSAHLTAVDWVLLVAGPAALCFRRQHPVIVLWLTLAATLTPSGAWPANLSLLVAFFTAAIGGHRQAAWVAVVLGYIGAAWLAPLAFGNSTASAEFALLLLAWLAVLVVMAELVRITRERRADRRAAQQREATRVASEERVRMARDLHDVIGHTISLINVQAGVGLDLLDTKPEQARASLAVIRMVSKDALVELRDMLAWMRDSGEAAPRSPCPGLARLTELVALTRSAGVAVSVETTGEPFSLPAAVDRAAYRIVQESLTNVTRHAHADTAVIRIGYGDTAIVIDVDDDGSSQPGIAEFTGAGSGIAGMRERATSLGGFLDAGPRPCGGFAVHAILPCRGTR